MCLILIFLERRLYVYMNEKYTETCCFTLHLNTLQLVCLNNSFGKVFLDNVCSGLQSRSAMTCCIWVRRLYMCYVEPKLHPLSAINEEQISGQDISGTIIRNFSDNSTYGGYVLSKLTPIVTSTRDSITDHHTLSHRCVCAPWSGVTA